MEYEKIKELMNNMGESKLSSLEITFPDGTKISMTQNFTSEKEATPNVNKEIIKETSATEENKETIGNVVKSPMVGTFYSKPSPTSNSYVEVGKQVKKGETLCIIEAMKLMNEIESEYSGEVQKILVKDGEIVEFGTPLFIIK